MIKSVFNLSLAQRHSYKINDSFSAISRANSIASKIIALIKFIILAPVNALYDSAYLLKKLLRRDIKKVSILDKFFDVFELARLKISKNFDIKHQPTVVKAALASTAILGLFYLYPRALQFFGIGKSPGQISRVKIALALLSTSITIGGFEYLRKGLEFYNLKNSDEYKEISRVKAEAESKYDEIDSIAELRSKHRTLINNIDKAIESIDMVLGAKANSFVRRKLEKDRKLLVIKKITLETSYKVRTWDIKNDFPPLVENKSYLALIESERDLENEFETLYSKDSSESIETFRERCCRIIEEIDNNLLEIYELQDIYSSKEELKFLDEKLRRHRLKFQDERNRAEDFIRETNSLPTHSMADNNPQILPIPSLDFEIPNSVDKIDKDEEESKTRDSDSFMDDPAYLLMYS